MGVDDYELGAAIVHTGAKAGGIPEAEARWAIGERPDVAETLGEHMRPLLTEYLRRLTPALEALADLRDPDF